MANFFNLLIFKEGSKYCGLCFMLLWIEIITFMFFPTECDTYYFSLKTGQWFLHQNILSVVIIFLSSRPRPTFESTSNCVSWFLIVSYIFRNLCTLSEGWISQTDCWKFSVRFSFSWTSVVLFSVLGLKIFLKFYWILLNSNSSKIATAASILGLVSS